MQQSPVLKAALFVLVLTVVSIGGWELYLRSQNITVDYDDAGALWSNKRAMVYEPSDKATVFIGSSRNKFDLDIATWQKLTGNHAIQLAKEGSSPLPVLDNLANDEKFKGRLVVDVTEILFFSEAPPNLAQPRSCIEYYKNETPAQLFSFKVNHLLESKLVFLDKNNFSLNGLLDKLGIQDRPTVFEGPRFPMDFRRINFERQCVMTDRFVADTNIQNKVKAVWGYLRSISKEPPASGHKLDSFMATIKTDVAKIKARGGQVLFVRTPSSGPFLMGERMGFPRQQYFDRILAETNCPGIHFEDYPAVAHFQCPEFSHLKPADAIVWTTNFVNILEKEKGWTFSHQPITE